MESGFDLAGSQRLVTFLALDFLAGVVPSVIPTPEVEIIVHHTKGLAGRHRMAGLVLRYAGSGHRPSPWRAGCRAVQGPVLARRTRRRLE